MTTPSPPPSEQRSLPPFSTEPEAATLQVSSPAPMFSFIGADGRWHRSEELIAHGPILVLFSPSEDDLMALQRLAPAFEELGVRPVPVLNLPTRGTAAVTRKLRLTGTLVSDPMCAIAGLYHSVVPSTGRHAPSYFVVDSHRILRAMYYGPIPPPELLVATAARSLGRPLPASVFSSSSSER